MKMNKKIKIGIMTALLAFSWSTNTFSNDINDKISFIKKEIFDDKKCETCASIIKPTVTIEDNNEQGEIIFSYEVNVEKDMFVEFDVPNGFRVEKITSRNDDINYFWNASNKVMVKLDKGIQELEIAGIATKDFTFNFNFKPKIINKSNKKYNLQGNTFIFKNNRISNTEGIELKDYEGYFSVNSTVALENNQYKVFHNIERTDLGGNKTTTIKIPKIIASETLVSQRSPYIKNKEGEWNILMQEGQRDFSFNTIANAESNLRLSLSPDKKYFQSLYFISAPNYQLYKNNELVDSIFLNTSKESEVNIDFKNVNIANANETLLENIKHSIKEKPYGYRHEIDFYASSSSPKEVKIEFETKGTINMVEGIDSISRIDGNNIIINNNVLGLKPTRIMFSLEEKVEKGIFLKKPANMNFDNISGYSIVFNKDDSKNLVAWVVGSFEGKAQSPLIIIALMSIIASFITINRKIINNSRENNIMILSLPILIVLSLLNSSFIFATLALVLLFITNKRMQKISNNEVFQTTKIISLFILIVYLFLVNRLDINYGSSLGNLSVIASNNVFLYSIYQSRDIMIFQIPFIIVLMTVSLPIILLLFYNIIMKPKIKTNNEE